jgi:hypothetical protein
MIQDDSGLAVASFASYQRHPGIIDPRQSVALCFTVSPCFTYLRSPRSENFIDAGPTGYEGDSGR